MIRPGDEVLRQASTFHPQTVLRRGGLVVRDTTPWTSSVHDLLRHLEHAGIEAPRVAGTGYDDDGRETITFLEGEVDAKVIWNVEGAHRLGQLLRRTHEALDSFRIDDDHHRWFPWRPGSLGTPSIVSHCDVGPWNVVRREGLPVALIDWTRAGPVDPLVELAQTCWLNAFLHDDVVAEAERLPSIGQRSELLRAIVDGYGLSRAGRESFVDLMIEVVVFSAADEADQAAVAPATVSAGAPKELVWALSWQIRGAAFLLANRPQLRTALL